MRFRFVFAFLHCFPAGIKRFVRTSVLPVYSKCISRVFMRDASLPYSRPLLNAHSSINICSNQVPLYNESLSMTTTLLIGWKETFTRFSSCNPLLCSWRFGLSTTSHYSCILVSFLFSLFSFLLFCFFFLPATTSFSLLILRPATFHWALFFKLDLFSKRDYTFSAIYSEVFISLFCPHLIS